ncbi:MAG: YbjN domain-containing protein [Actinomycetia bacterium]|nr:YbjN domain-containing protein [Actinomycetes bacterium]
MTAPTGIEPSPLLAIAVAALQSRGRVVDTNWDAQTFTVRALRPDVETTLGVVFNFTGSIVFYYVWEDDLPDERMAALAEFVLRANEKLTTSAFELSLGRRDLALRAGVAFGEDYLDLDRGAVTALLVNALEECERAAYAHRGAVAAVLAGTSPAESLTKVA